ncbi:MAG: peptidylprolyl isomerase [Flavisolibacter sp.]|nr:peptidylprolyl isomerase [Flavisolibacter sp.]
MRKHIIATCCFFLFAFYVNAQTLFTYGNESVTVKEFLEAYEKNNTGPKSAKALQDYFDLYLASRLKIKEAKARGYDTLPQLASDLNGLREQIAPSFLNDEESMNKMVQEAFARSQKDIHVAHIFVSFINKNGAYDTVGARQQALAALKELQHGEAFATVAKKYSADPAVTTNGGDIGYITVFTLPYELENVIYNTPSGSVSPLYQSKGGYHIFKNLGERKAAGRIKAAQIVLAFPADADAATKQQAKKKADSLYQRLLKGGDFAKLAAQFSNDALSATANGQLPEFSVGQYDPAFEATVLALPKDGAFSKPLLSANGYYIIKRLGRTPVPYTIDAKTRQELREKVAQSDRMQATTRALAKKVLEEVPFQKAPFRETELWAYTDSALDSRTSGVHTSLNSESELFQLGSINHTVKDWLQYAQTYRYKSDGSGLKPYSQLWNEFVQGVALNYYKDHLEEYNPVFRRQINEFKDGNLFFEIMQREVWGPAQTDTAALMAFYEKNKSKYTWKESADAVLFYASDAATARELWEQFKKESTNWKVLAANLGDKIVTDSGRFEKEQIPNATKLPIKEGTVTVPVINKNDNTASFAYIIKVYHQQGQRSFTEAKGLLINDYQAELEKKWVEELKKKYPIVVNQQALASLASR